MTGMVAAGLGRFVGRRKPSGAAAASEELGTPAERVRRAGREDALQGLDLSRVAQAYLAGEAVYLGRGDFWKWEVDGIPGWLVPKLQDLGFLP